VADRRRIGLILRLGLVAAVVVFGGRYLLTEWDAVRAHAAALDPRPSLLTVATAVVLATYALLIQLWRLVLTRWGARLSFGDAAFIWSVSNLGRFVPGRVAQIGAMAYLARERGVSGGAAAGSALLNTLVNIAAGVVVALLAGGRLLERYRPGARVAGVAVAVAAVLALIALPWLLPRAAAFAARLLRRPLAVAPEMPAAAVWLTGAGNALAWLLYGAAFQLFTVGLLGHASSGTWSYVAVYTGSYIIGYLAFFTPGGLGAREGALVFFMTALGMASVAEATLVSVASRLWLTLLEVLPGLLFLAAAAVRRRPPTAPGDAPT
jgi:hypothetical protein